ncbi:MAG: N-acetylmuramoyl-L-alanine amidase [Anaeroplasmataceae bacterium]|nr:N-acetylmuramoyl-L-alanine amidase [Anaeroplasmataceae bacterium]
MKKRYLFLFLLLCIAFVLFTTKIFAEVEPLVVYIDPGHGGMDGGASIGNIKESTLTLEISKKIKEVFEKSSIQVMLTRENDDDLSDGDFVKREDMLKRVNTINTSSAALALSIHLNKFSIEKYRGAQVFYSKTNSNNQLLAETMQTSLCNYLKNTERKIVKRENIFLLNKVTIPCCIVECGFMSNKEEFQLLQTEEYQYKIAYALLYGVEDYLKLY